MIDRYQTLSLAELELGQNFPLRVHPQWEEVEGIVDDISQKLDIILPHYDNYKTMPYFIFPETSVERLVALSVFSNLLYYIDDCYDRHKTDPHPETADLPRIFKQTIKIFCQGDAAMPAERHRLYDVARALHDYFLELSNDAWFHRFTHALAAHLISTTQGTSTTGLKQYASAEEYFHIRELDGGIWTTMYSIEFAADCYLPIEIHEHPHIRRMGLLCGRVATLSNDLFSYEKEVIQMGSEFNLIVVLMQTESLTFEQAVHSAIQSMNNDIHEFIEACASVPDFGDEDLNCAVQIYIQGLYALMGATWHWQMNTDRYRSPESPFVELRTTFKK
jgi:hypothetical protein